MRERWLSTRGQIVACLVLAAAMAGFLMPFVPHPFLRGFSGLLFAFCAAMLTIAVIGACLVRSRKPHALNFLFWLATVGIAFLTPCLWAIGAKTLPGLWTLHHGVAVRERAVARVYYGSSAGCRFSARVALEGAFPDICIGPWRQALRGDGAVPVVYSGRRSALGLFVEHVDVEVARQ